MLILLLTPPAVAEDAAESINVDGIQVFLWLPQKVAGSPVILFSHGFHGCGTQSTFLMKALADAGYAVFAPNHADAVCNGGKAHWFSGPEVGFGKAGEWDDKVYTDRKKDMKALLTQLPEDGRFRDLDWDHVGLAGHSLGGYTVLALGGAWPHWKDGRVKAVLALSPYSAPFVEKHTLGKISVPVMYQGGTRDWSITPGVKKGGGAYDQTPEPKYFVEIDGAGHFAFADLRDAHHDVMSEYAVAFFDTYLRGKPFPQLLRQKGEGVSELKIDAGQGTP